MELLIKTTWYSRCYISSIYRSTLSNSHLKHLILPGTPGTYWYCCTLAGTGGTNITNDACTLTKRGVAGEAVEVDPSAVLNHDGVCTGVRAILMLVAPEELSSAQIEEGF